jgi:indolepyruvate ferredoxin oxidoreductase, beta subunit
MHGMSQRGGAVVSTVIVGEGHGPIVPDGEADLLVAFEPIEAVRALRYCSPKTLAVVNTRVLLPPNVSASGGKGPSEAALLGALRARCAGVLAFDATAEAERAGTVRATNSAVLGALAGTGRLPIPDDRILDAIRTLVQPAAAEANARAFAAGRAFARRHIAASSTR